MDVLRSFWHRGCEGRCVPLLSHSPRGGRDDSATKQLQHTSLPRAYHARVQVNLQLRFGTLPFPYDRHNHETADCATPCYANLHAALVFRPSAARACTQSQPAVTTHSALRD